MLRLLTISLLVLAVGCGPAATDDSTSQKPAEDQTDAHAGHDHGEMGPHGGHLLHLEPTGLHAEWTHDDEAHLISVFVDDLAAEDINEIKFIAKLDGGETEEFAMEATDEGWAITSEALMTHLNMGEAVNVDLVVVCKDGEQSTKIEAHDHHHH